MGFGSLGRLGGNLNDATQDMPLSKEYDQTRARLYQQHAISTSLLTAEYVVGTVSVTADGLAALRSVSFRSCAVGVMSLQKLVRHSYSFGLLRTTDRQINQICNELPANNLIILTDCLEATRG